MKNLFQIFWYTMLVVTTFAVDRVTKLMAIGAGWDNQPVAPFLSFDLVYNRGISWGLFHSSDDAVFKLVSAVIALVLIGLLGYTYYCWQRGELLVGHMLALSGGIANLVDRFVYGGVVDFIRFFVGDWSFPIFNGADIFICCGVGIMIITAWRFHD